MLPPHAQLCPSSWQGSSYNMAFGFGLIPRFPGLAHISMGGGRGEGAGRAEGWRTLDLSAERLDFPFQIYFVLGESWPPALHKS